MEYKEDLALAKAEQRRTPQWFRKIENKIMTIIDLRLDARSSNTKKIPTTLKAYKRYAKQNIDTEAGKIRASFITPIFGQEAIYAEKSEEAVDYISSGYPTDLSNYPLINAEVKATGNKPKDVVNRILKKKTEWLSLNAKIEEIRLRAKMSIDSKDITSIDEIKDIMQQAIGSLVDLS